MGKDCDTTKEKERVVGEGDRRVDNANCVFRLMQKTVHCVKYLPKLFALCSN